MNRPNYRRQGFYITQIDSGCYATTADLNKYIALLENNSYYRTSDIKKASLILVSTCVALNKSEADSLQTIEALIKAKHKDAKLIICGCMATTHRNLLYEKFSESFFGVFGPREIDAFVDMLKLSPEADNTPISETKLYELSKGANKRKLIIRLFRLCHAVIRKLNTGVAGRLERFLNTAKIYGPESYVLRVAEGCAGACTYCIIKKARGNLVSRPLEDIRQEALQAVARGYRHLVIVSEDFSSYGMDIGLDSPELIKTLFTVDTDVTFSLCHVNPMRLIKKLDRFLEIIQPGRILNIEYTVQHGSNRILSLMNRNHKIEDYVASVRALWVKDPGITFKTHLIVGFPGERACDFRDILELVKHVRFDQLSAFKYSDRPGTEACSFPEKVPYYKKCWRKTVVESYYLVKWLRYIIAGRY